MDKETELCLKVMRLSRPQPLQTNEISLASPDALASLATAAPDLNITTFVPELLLPCSFDNIHMGEYLNCILVLTNILPFPVCSVSLRIELQTPTQRINLSQQSSTMAQLEPKKFCTSIIRQEIKESGQHKMVCAIHYKHEESDQENKFIRKSYRFQVINPISVKTKVTACQDSLFLEALIQNLSADCFYLNSVKFEPSEFFSLLDLNHNNAEGSASFDHLQDSSSVFGGTEFKPDDMRQYLFQLTPKSPDFAKRTIALGKIDVQWTSSMCETGRLQTSSLTRKVANLPPDIEIHLLSISSKPALEEPFGMTFQVRANTEALPDLTLSFSSSNPDVSAVGTVAPITLMNGATIQLFFVSSVPGLQKIQGFVAFNRDTGVRQELQDSFDIFVHTTA